MLNELAKEIHENAVAHGWWDEPRSFGDIVALCHSELSEALEEYRAGRPMSFVLDLDGPDDECSRCQQNISEFSGRKPEGIAVELIDCIIRILDYLGKEGVDVDALIKLKHEYNKTRPYRHGGKAL